MITITIVIISVISIVIIIRECDLRGSARVRPVSQPGERLMFIYIYIYIEREREIRICYIMY